MAERRKGKRLRHPLAATPTLFLLGSLPGAAKPAAEPVQYGVVLQELLIV
jgi:hypothetical protein